MAFGVVGASVVIGVVEFVGVVVAFGVVVASVVVVVVGEDLEEQGEDLEEQGVLLGRVEGHWLDKSGTVQRGND